MILDIKRKKKEKRIQLIGGLIGICVAVVSLFYFFHVEKTEAEKMCIRDRYRALDVLGSECDLIQADVYKNSHFLEKRNDKIFYCDCSNYYFEIEQEDGIKKYGKSKEHRPNPIIQMGLFMDCLLYTSRCV